MELTEKNVVKTFTIVMTEKEAYDVASELLGNRERGSIRDGANALLNVLANRNTDV